MPTNQTFSTIISRSAHLQKAGLAASLAAAVYLTSSSLAPAANWTASGPLYSARVFSIATDPKDANVVYAGGIGKLYKSTDQGNNYTILTLPAFRFREVTQILINPNNTSEIYAVAGNYDASPGYYENEIAPFYKWNSFSLFHSVDSGKTWTLTSNLPSSDSGYAATISVSWARNNRVFAFGNNNKTKTDYIFASNDSGRTFSQIFNDAFASSTLQSTRSSIAYDGLSNLYMFGSRLLSHSITNNTTSYISTSYIYPFYNYPTSISINPKSNSRICFSTSGAILQDSALFCTYDRFASSFSALPVSAYNHVNATAFAYGTAERLLISYYGPQVWLAGYAGTAIHPLGRTDAIMYSTNLINQAWKSSNIDRPVALVTQFSSSKVSTNLVFAATDGTGILKSTDRGASWVSQNAGVKGGIVTSIARNGITGNVYLSTLGNGVKKSTNAGTSWASLGLTSGQPFVLSLYFDDATGTLYSGTQNGLYTLKKGASFWTKFNFPFSEPVRGVLVSPFDKNVILARGVDIGDLYSTAKTNYITTDGGNIWTSFGNWNGRSVNGPVYMSLEKAGLIFSSLSGDMYSTQKGTLRSTDNGKTWIRVLANVLQSITPARSAPRTIFACRDDGVIVRSTNGGLNWAARSNPSDASGSMNCLFDNLGINNVSMIAVNPSDPLDVYAVFKDNVKFSGGASVENGGLGLFESKDGGATWIAVKTGCPLFPNGRALDITGLFPAGDRLFLGTNGMGAWSTPW